MFPLGSVLLPGGKLPLHIFEPRYRQLVRDCLDAPDGPRFGVVLIARGREVGGGDVRHEVATVARITEALALRDGRYALDCVGQERVRVGRWLAEEPYPRAEVAPWPDVEQGAADLEPVRSAVARAWDLMGAVARRRGLGPLPDPWQGLPADPEAALFALADRLPLGEADRYGVLAAPGARERADVLAEAVGGLAEVLEFELADRG